jgi:hypothetical protein
MKPINLYFAAAWSSSCHDEERGLGISKKLVSYAYPKQLTSWLEITKDTPGKLMIDSGAFSAWNKNKTIDIMAYIAYAHEAIRAGEATGKEVHIVNLDVIPGKVGETGALTKNRKESNKDKINVSAKEGYKNLKTMKRNGITPIHVFHQGEDFKWLDRMVQQTQYIGISPANDMAQNSKKAWICSVFEYLYKNNLEHIDTHGFAVWSPKALLEFPWTSCDAATWRLLAAYGGIFYPVGGFANADYSKQPSCIHPTEKKNEGSVICRRMLEADGYTYADLQHWSARAEVNVRYFLELERWLNEQKAKMEFKCSSSFGF